MSLPQSIAVASTPQFGAIGIGTAAATDGITSSGATFSITGNSFSTAGSAASGFSITSNTNTGNTNGTKGGPIKIQAGGATGATFGDGGDVNIYGGTTANGTAGSVNINTTLANSGLVNLGYNGGVGVTLNGQAIKAPNLSTGTTQALLRIDSSTGQLYKDATTTYLTTAVTSLAGTTNQVSVSGSTGSVTVSLPSSVTISGTMTAGTLTGSTVNSSGALSITSGSTGTVSINTPVSSTPNVSSGAITIQSGNQVGGGVGTAGTVTLDTGSSAGTTSSLNIGTTNAGTISIGRPTTGSTLIYNPLLGRINSTDEGGQINFARPSDNAQYWYIDSYGTAGTPSGSTPDLRVIENTTERFRFVSGGALSVGGSTGSSGQVLTSAGSGSAPTWTTIGSSTTYYYSPRSTITLSSTTAAQSPLNLTNGVTLTSGNTYTVEFYFQGGCGTTSGQLQFTSTGTATYTNSIWISAARPASSSTLVSPEVRLVTVTGGTVANVASAGTGATWLMYGVGQINVTANGTWNPQIAFSVAPGTTVSATAACFVRITLAGTTGTPTSSGTWS